uniref:Uncharacterized protein n=1 Tax=Kalanchoe fedtschenkoi TaxID=63787 RepID=A0A7N0SWN5_KALFE
MTGRDLVDEAKFLKACGVLVETPADIRKAREKLQYSKEQDLGSGSPEFHSWYPNTSVEKLCLKNEGRVKSLKPMKLCEECQDGVLCPEHSTESGVAETHNKGDSSTDEENSQLASIASSNEFQDNELDNTPVLNSPQPPSIAVKSRAKSVHFAREPETPVRSSYRCLSEKVGQGSCKVEMPGYDGVFKYSPHPTPLKLTDEMQTPGTTYALDSATKGRNVLIRSQYVYSALNSIEDISQWRLLKEVEEEGEGEMEEPNNDASQQPDSLKESSERRCYDTPSHYSSKENEAAVDKDLKVEASLSGLTPGSRPVLGVLPASDWNCHGSSDMSPKCWDGNGIPNTTNKYKEDQEVKWHGTPFEERLLKALSAEGSNPEGWHINGRPIVYVDEEDESRESLHSKPIAPGFSHAKVEYSDTSSIS